MLGFEVEAIRGPCHEGPPETTNVYNLVKFGESCWVQVKAKKSKPISVAPRGEREAVAPAWGGITGTSPPPSHATLSEIQVILT